MTQDKDAQVILIESSVSGSFCFEYRNGQWVDINGDYQLAGFIEAEVAKVQ